MSLSFDLPAGSLQDYAVMKGGAMIGKASLLRGTTNLNCCADGITYIPFGQVNQPPQEDQGHSEETGLSMVVMKDPLLSSFEEEVGSAESKIATTLIEASGDTSTHSENNVIEFGRLLSSNQDGIGEVGDVETNDEDNDVEFMASSTPKRKTKAGQTSKCQECNVMVSTSNMSRHIKQYHCEGGQFYKSAPARKAKVRTAKMKCEFCGKQLARSYLARHIQDVHKNKKCRWCDLVFSFKHSHVDHERMCRKFLS